MMFTNLAFELNSVRSKHLVFSKNLLVLQNSVVVCLIEDQYILRKTERV